MDVELEADKFQVLFEKISNNAPAIRSDKIALRSNVTEQAWFEGSSKKSTLASKKGRDITKRQWMVRKQPHTFLHHHTPTSRHSPLDAPFCSSRFVIIQPLRLLASSLWSRFEIHTTTSATPPDSSH